MAQVKKARKRKVIVESEGIAYILASFNNVIVTITNKQGQVVAWSSSGREGFRGSKKYTLQPRRPHLMQLLSHMRLEFGLPMCLLKDLEMVAKQLSEELMMLVSKW